MFVSRFLWSNKINAKQHGRNTYWDIFSKLTLYRNIPWRGIHTFDVNVRVTRGIKSFFIRHDVWRWWCGPRKKCVEKRSSGENLSLSLNLTWTLIKPREYLRNFPRHPSRKRCAESEWENPRTKSSDENETRATQLSHCFLMFCICDIVA